MNHKVYLGGPISGLKFDDAENWRTEAKAKLKEYNIDGYSPLRKKEILRSRGTIEGSYDLSPLATARGIMTRDSNDVKTSDAVIVNLLGAERVSIGTVMELAFCYKDRIPVVMICEEDNIHWVHPFVQESVGYRVDTLDEAVDVVASILLP